MKIKINGLTQLQDILIYKSLYCVYYRDVFNREID